MSNFKQEDENSTNLRCMKDLQSKIVEDVLILSNNEYYQNVQIICKNGIIHSNSFVLAAIFPKFENILRDEDEQLQVVVIPEMDVSELKIFFQCLFSKDTKSFNSVAIVDLLRPSDYFKMEICDTEVDKEEIVDFALLDPDFMESSPQMEEEKVKINILPETIRDSIIESHLKDHQTKNWIKKERKFECSICDFKTSWKTSLTLHMKKDKHNVKKPHDKPKPETMACDQCGKLFPRKANLMMHVKNVHENSGNHICNVCGDVLGSKSGLRHHLRTHEEKKPCPECGILVRNLKDHVQRSHTIDELKKHQCQDCGKGFINKDALNKHRMNVHLRLRPFKCRYGCEFGYNDPANRNSHERKKHGKIYMIGGVREEIANVMAEVKEFI